MVSILFCCAMNFPHARIKLKNLASNSYSHCHLLYFKNPRKSDTGCKVTHLQREIQSLSPGAEVEEMMQPNSGPEQRR